MEGQRSPSQASLIALLDSLDPIVWIAAGEPLSFSFVSRRSETLLGYAPERWRGAEAVWPGLLHPDDRAGVLALCTEVRHDGTPRDRVHRLTDQQGRLRWFRTRVSPGEAGTLVGEMSEVQAPVQPRPLPESQTWLRLLLDQYPLAYWAVDRELRFVEVSTSAAMQQDNPSVDLVGQPAQTLLGSLDPNLTGIAQHYRALQGESARYRTRLEGRTFDCFVEPWRDAEGTIVGARGLALDVTEKDQAEDRYRLIVESAAEGIWTVDAVGRTTFVNRNLAELLGYSVEEIIGRPAANFYDESLQALVDERFRQRRNGAHERYDFMFRHRSGREVWVSLSASPMFDDGGRYLGAFSMFFDITERRRAEQERERLLRDIDARRLLLESIVQHAPAGILVLRGADFRVEMANPTAHALMPGKQMEGLRWYDDVAPELAPLVRPQVEEVMRTGKPQHVTEAYMPVRASPTAPLMDHWVTSSRVPIQLPDGERGVMLMFIDNTNVVHSRREVERLAAISAGQAALLKAILDHMTDAVVAYDAKGQVVFANHACTMLLGVPARETSTPSGHQFAALLGGHLSDEGEGSEAPGLVSQVLAGAALPEREASFIQEGTGRNMTVRTSIVPIRDQGGGITGAILVSRDVTGLTQFERLKDEFIGVAAHELKTPVAIMKANAQFILASSDPLTPRQTRMAEAIDRGANRIDKIIQDLLDISQLRMNTLTLSFGEVDFAGMVRAAVQRASEKDPERISLTVTGPLRVHGDAHRISWILTHLLDNAIRYSPGGGPIEVKLQHRVDGALLTVRDWGVGIARDRQERIFERFYRGHTGTPYDYGGLGVSLYIAREIARQHGGEMWFESQVGRGSTFYLLLPDGDSHGASPVPARGG